MSESARKTLNYAQFRHRKELVKKALTEVAKHEAMKAGIRAIAHSILDKCRGNPNSVRAYTIDGDGNVEDFGEFPKPDNWR